MSKPLYAGNDPDPVDIEMAGLHLVTRSEIIEALGIDYEAAYRVMFPDMHLEGSETTEFDESWCRSIVDAALGLGDDE